MGTMKREIQKQIAKFEISKDDKEYIPALILLTALDCGANADRISKDCGIPRATCRAIGKRLRETGIWKGGLTCCEWFEKNGGVAFILDVNVALGFMNREN